MPFYRTSRLRSQIPQPVSLETARRTPLAFTISAVFRSVHTSLSLRRRALRSGKGTLDVEAGQSVMIDPTMEVGSLQTTVSVSDSAPDNHYRGEPGERCKRCPSHSRFAAEWPPDFKPVQFDAGRGRRR